MKEGLFGVLKRGARAMLFVVGSPIFIGVALIISAPYIGRPIATALAWIFLAVMSCSVGTLILRILSAERARKDG